MSPDYLCTVDDAQHNTHRVFVERFCRLHRAAAGCGDGLGGGVRQIDRQRLMNG